jgi:dTDP-glucose 4,6-dehydratase
MGELEHDLAAGMAGRTCLVTGADGFMGSHLAEALVNVGADVHVFVRATNRDRWIGRVDWR